MKPIKDFDCVRMKWDIQQKLLSEERSLGHEEARRRRAERLRGDPVLGPFLQRVEAEERRKASEILDRLSGKS
jgi:hypothetical protein